MKTITRNVEVEVEIEIEEVLDDMDVGDIIDHLGADKVLDEIPHPELFEHLAQSFQNDPVTVRHLKNAEQSAMGLEPQEEGFRTPDQFVEALRHVSCMGIDDFQRVFNLEMGTHLWKKLEGYGDVAKFICYLDSSNLYILVAECIKHNAKVFKDGLPPARQFARGRAPTTDGSGRGEEA